MKRLLSTIAFVLCALTGHAQYSGSGSGTTDDPYLIFNVTQLSQLSNFLGQDSVVFKLMNNLNLTSWIAENSPSQGWLPIGVESAPFQGVLLGNNKTISGLSINRSTTNCVGFFGHTNGATISDLTIEGADITGANYTGTFVGKAVGSTLTNCHVSLSGQVTCASFSGGFAGFLSDGCNVSNCSVAAMVTGSNSNIGGFAGKAQNSCSISNCSQNGDVTAKDATGGFLGTNSGSTVSAVTSLGDIVGLTKYTAGICGLSQGTVSYSNCKHTGNVSGQQQDVGGILGKMQTGCVATLTSCASKGTITNAGDNTGGVIGLVDGAKIASMQGCSHFGDIAGQNYVGGLVGQVTSIAAPSLSTYHWSTSSTTNKKSGTFYDTIQNGTNATSPINNCVCIGNISGNNYIGGLMGRDIPYYSYRYGVKTANRPSTAFYYYVWKDNVLTSNSVTSYKYSYARDVVNLSLTNNYYSGTINGSQFVGGLVGQKSGGQISNCYSYGSMYGATNVGGIAGQITDDVAEQSYNTTTIKSNVANCAIVSATSANVGRIYGSLVNPSHATIGALGSTEGNRGLTTTHLSQQGVTQVVEDNLQNGTSIGPSLLRLKATYVAMGWDCDNDWEILETESFPYKTYQTAPPIIDSDLVSQATSISGRSTDGGTVYLLYKNNAAVGATCTGNDWTFQTGPLQSGAQVRVYAEANNLIPSYLTTGYVTFPGSGTEADPYLIYTAEDLQGATKSAYYKVMNNIDLTSWINENSPTEGWVAIGRNSGDGTYIDGDGHKITGLWTNTTDDYTGLFSNYSSGCIKNLTVEVATGKKVKGGNYTGVLIGRFANGQILNCTVKGDAEGTQYVGGVVGYVDTTPIDTVSYNGTIATATANACAGGLVGYANASNISNSVTTTTINATGNTSNVGGLAGQTVGGTLSQVKADAIVSATGTQGRVGGLVGYANSVIERSLSTGSVSATGTQSYTGGLVGLTNDYSVTNSYSTSTITGTEYSAGLVGYANNTAIDKCYAQGDISGVMYGAGVVGELEAANAVLTNSVALNNILELTDQSSWGTRVIGGYKNGAADPEENNYALATMQVSLNNVPQTKADDLVEGIAKSDALLKQAGTYTSLGWNFTDVWMIDEGNAYPRLKWEATATPSNYVQGDANGDGEVNVTDYMAIANFILGQNPTDFNETAADVNEDGSVNVSDYVGVANIILYGNYTGSTGNAVKAYTTDNRQAWMEIEEENGLLNLRLHDAKTFSAFQMNICLPEGVEIASARMAKAGQIRNLGIAHLNDGTWQLLYGTLENNAVQMSDDSLLTLVLKGNNGGRIVVDNIILAMPDASMQYVNGVNAGLSTGITLTGNDIKEDSYYDLTGRRIVNSQVKKGVYVVNGKKMLIK